jgi:hypothetical protein
MWSICVAKRAKKADTQGAIRASLTSGRSAAGATVQRLAVDSNRWAFLVAILAKFVRITAASAQSSKQTRRAARAHADGA